MQSRVDVLDERRARRERQQLGQEVTQRVVHGDRAIGPRDPHVHVQPEGVVPPDDVAEELVVPPVVRRVDDPLVLPAAPRMRRRAAEGDRELARDRVDLPAALSHRGRDLAEPRALARSHLDLGRDQLSDDVRRKVGLDRRRIDVLESVRQLQRLRIEERELLLDGDGQVGPGVERLARLREQLLPGNPLLLAHPARA